MRVTDNGNTRVYINTTTGMTPDESNLTVIGDGIDDAITGAAGIGYGVYGQTLGPLAGVAGYALDANASGVEAVNLDDNGTGLFVLGQNAPSYYTLPGGSGISSNGKDYGIISFGQNTTGGTGVAAIGNGLSTIHSLSDGQGGAFAGTNTGLYAISTLANSTGIIGVGQNASSIMSLTNGSGAAFTGDKTGLYVYNTGDNATEDEETILTQNSWGNQWKVGAWDDVNSNWYKIIGNGSVSTIVKDLNEEDVVMFAPESPENKFIDYGHGKLVNGSVYIEIDPIFAKNILVDEKHPLLVYIQPEGDCNGVFVTNKTKNGFEVKELAGGNSNISFSYSIVAARGEERYINDKGVERVAKYDQRFPRYHKAENKELEKNNTELKEVKRQNSLRK